MSFKVTIDVFFRKRSQFNMEETYVVTDGQFKHAEMIYQEAQRDFAKKYHLEEENAFRFLPDDCLIPIALEFLQAKFNSAHINYSSYCYCGQEAIKKEDILNSEFVAYRVLGEDLTNCTKGNTTIPVICSRCGLKDEDCTYLPKFKLRGRRTHLSLFSIWGIYNIFCRVKFINAYKDSGLSGLSFERIDDSFFSYVPASEREDVWRVKFNVHQWGGGVKACPECGRHPTFDEADFWDAEEDYKFDFQLLKCRNSFARVYSLNAWKFLQEFSPFETDPEFCFCVIRPKAKL